VEHYPQSTCRVWLPGEYSDHCIELFQKTWRSSTAAIVLLSMHPSSINLVNDSTISLPIKNPAFGGVEVNHPDVLEAKS